MGRALLAPLAEELGLTKPAVHARIVEARVAHATLVKELELRMPAACARAAKDLVHPVGILPLAPHVKETGLIKLAICVRIVEGLVNSAKKVLPLYPGKWVLLAPFAMELGSMKLASCVRIAGVQVNLI